MKKKLIYAVLICTLLMIGITAVNALPTTDNELESKITKVKERLFAGNRGMNDCKEGFHCLMEAMQVNLSEAGQSAELNNKITEAAKKFKANGIFDETACNSIKEAYRTMNAGRNFTIPAD
ncbi:MAG: hypothetical protein GY765_02890 [bacterium]|nr:hypothetical protein [bacterium]